MADELRVLQVVPALSKESGVMRYTWNMMREASANGIVFDYLYHISDTLTFEEECLEQGSRIYRVPNAAENRTGASDNPLPRSEFGFLCAEGSKKRRRTPSIAP